SRARTRFVFLFSAAKLEGLRSDPEAFSVLGRTSPSDVASSVQGAYAFSDMQLTSTQRAVIVGTLLGDGSMRCKSNALLEVNHAAAQRTYVDWKYSILRELVGTPPTRPDRRVPPPRVGLQAA
ncbi:MAG: hypothetical protein KGJ98_08435, partial [Chloroflexota bacterium]|nr:hypothetical protein [Chloroflexota bacterium]